MIQRAFILGATLALVAVPSLAQLPELEFEVPEHCESLMTVQLRGCAVVHHYRCEGFPGEIISYNVDSDNNLTLQRHDEEYRALEYRDPANGLLIELEEPEPDPLSLSELNETGLDTYEFVDIVNGGPRFVNKGFDKLTGVEVEIDGRLLRMTEFSYTLTSEDDELISNRSGQQFLDPDFPIFHPGIFIDHLDSEGTVDNSPADFLFPGDAAFLSRRPKFDCNADL